MLQVSKQLIPQNNPRFPQLNHSMASLLSTQGTSLFVWIPGGWHHAIGTTSTHVNLRKKRRKMAMKLKHYSWFRVVFCFCLGGKETFLRLKMQKLRGSFSKCLRDPFLAFGYVFSLPNHPALGFWMLMWSTNLLSYLSAHTKDCQGQKSQRDEGHESWRNHNLLGDGVMSRG